MAFNKVKKLVTEAPVLSYYDPTHELEIQCDASQTGLGAALLQEGRPIAYTSRALTDTEERYAQIGKEMLAIVFSLEKFNQYTLGMMMRLQKYNIEVQYERGTQMHIADMLSRAYLPDNTSVGDQDFEQINMSSFLPITDRRLLEIQQETEEDKVLQKLKKVI